MSNGQSTWEAGSFIDGPEISKDPNLPTGGEASYTGIATGNYAAILGTEFEIIGEETDISGWYDGDFTATANFSNGGGTLSGEIIVTESTEYLSYRDTLRKHTNFVKDSEISWSGIEFDSDGQASGDVTVTIPGLGREASGGKTGNKFSSENTGGNPRLIAGTHGGSFESTGGTEVGFIGVHIGAINQ